MGPSPTEIPPGRLVVWLPSSANGKKQKIVNFLSTLPYFFETLLEDPDLITQLLARPGDGFLVTAPRTENDRSTTHKKWLLVFLANNDTIIKVNIIYLDRKFVLAKERKNTMLQFIEDQDLKMIERPIFFSRKQITEKMPITPNLAFPIVEGTFPLGVLSQKTLSFDEDRKISCFELDCSHHDKNTKQNLFEEARKMINFGSRRIWRLWGILYEEDVLKFVLEDVVFGSLREFVRLSKAKESQLKKLSLQMAESLRYLEKFNFVHFRLSLDAFLLTFSYNIKLAVYGMDETKLISAEGGLDELDRHRWVPPESLPAPALPSGDIPADRVPYNKEGMVYTFGSCLFSMFHRGVQPYEDEPPENVRDRAWRLENPPVPEAESMPKEMAHVCWRCWRKPAERPGFKELKQRLRKLQDSYYF
ncbi:hypothetical protein FO519_001326 [Halicephalobus sp. NKZ332]|nr:hypothetical protein FO519_001326 [Halicephalobus sp. NKZ332]